MPALGGELVTLTKETPFSTEPLHGASPLSAMKRFFMHAFRVRGRASRSEYWWWTLVNAATLFVTQLAFPRLMSSQAPQESIVIGPFGAGFFASIPLITWQDTVETSSPIATFVLFFAAVWVMVTAIPGFTVAVRRLHDSNLSGLWTLLVFAPAGSFILLLLALRRSRFEGIRFD